MVLHNYSAVQSKFSSGIKGMFIKSLNKARAEPEPADLQWSGQNIRLDFNLLMSYSITFLPILYMESGDT